MEEGKIEISSTGPVTPTRQDFWPPIPKEDKGKAGANLRHAA